MKITTWIGGLIITGLVATTVSTALREVRFEAAVLNKELTQQTKAAEDLRRNLLAVTEEKNGLESKLKEIEEEKLTLGAGINQQEDFNRECVVTLAAKEKEVKNLSQLLGDKLAGIDSVNQQVAALKQELENSSTYQEELELVREQTRKQIDEVNQKLEELAKRNYAGVSLGTVVLGK